MTPIVHGWLWNVYSVISYQKFANNTTLPIPGLLIYVTKIPIKQTFIESQRKQVPSLSLS